MEKSDHTRPRCDCVQNSEVVVDGCQYLHATVVELVLTSWKNGLADRICFTIDRENHQYDPIG